MVSLRSDLLFQELQSCQIRIYLILFLYVFKLARNQLELIMTVSKEANTLLREYGLIVLSKIKGRRDYNTAEQSRMLEIQSTLDMNHKQILSELERYLSGTVSR